MICTCLQHKTLEEILEILQDPYVEMAEIRLDRCNLDGEEIDYLFSTSDIPLIATCRAAECPEAEVLLERAVRAGAHFLDLELEAPVQQSKKFRNLCAECGTRLIRSYHDESSTPDISYLRQVVDRCFRYGADIAKVVATASSREDGQHLLSLYEGASPGTLVVFAMGDEGRESRIECIRRGAPFTYASLCDEEITAAGQYTFEEMHEKIYGEGGNFFRHNLPMPSSKSFAQRAIIAAALAEGTSHLRGYTPCEDSESAIEVAKALGAKVRRGRTLTIQGIGPLKAPLGLSGLNTGESGLLTRLMVPVMAGINGAPFVIDGRKTLLTRPLNGIGDIMASFGVLVKEDRVPVKVNESLMPGTAEISGKCGSQLISGLLMSLPLASSPSALYVNEPKSLPYMFITMDVMKRFGVKVKSEMMGDEQLIENEDWSGCTRIAFKIRGNQKYKAADFDIEADWSAASNFLVAGAIFGGVELDGLDSKSLQADLSILDVLAEAGVYVSEDEDTAAVSLAKAPLEAFEFDLNNAPDIFPITALLAAFCAGESRISGVKRLEGKESDRAGAIVEMLSKMGVPVRVEGDDMIICGESYASRIMNGRLLRGGKYSSHHDHRMVMALRVAQIGADSPIEIDDSGCVAKSFPGFFEIFD